MTDDERKAHRVEYMREYRKENAERIKELKREHYHRKAAKEKTYTCVVCGRELTQEMFLDSKGRRRHGGKCNDCLDAGKRKPRVGNGNGPRSEYAKKYYSEHKEEIKAKQVLGSLERERPAAKPKPIKPKARRMCETCQGWPCFVGIENLESDFAKCGCRGFRPRGEAV